MLCPSRHFRVQAMLARDSVKSRLAGDNAAGISFTEFSYQLFQSHDFARLASDYGCIAQVGGNDQWGNITAGVDLVRRTLEKVEEMRRPLCLDAFASCLFVLVSHRRCTASLSHC